MNKLSINIKLIGVSILMLATIVVLMNFVSKVSANPSYFLRFQQANGTARVATTSVNYMTPGTATTTYYVDAQLGSFAVDSAILAIQYSATNTSSILGWRYEYAHDTAGFDCTQTPTACDWYSEDVINRTNATTTQSIDLSVPFIHTWKYSSSTDMCSSSQSAATNNRGCKLVNVPLPTRYARAVFYVPIGASNGAVWAEFVAKKEN